MVYQTFMIVFEKDEDRFRNWININKIMENNIKKFTAIDCINQYPKWRQFALQNNYCSIEYIRNEVERVGTGKLGCNLSHQLLLESIEKEYLQYLEYLKYLEKNKNDFGKISNNLDEVNKPIEWYLILEDDVGIKDTFKNIDNFLKTTIKKLEIESPDSKYIQLCIYDNFFSQQTNAPNIFDTTHTKIPQYGTCAYLIHIDAIRYLNFIKPWDKNIDFIYNSLDKQFKSVATFNPYFYCQGTIDRQDDHTKGLGSLIWN